MPKARAKDNLTDKQRRFCEEYVKDWNATQAALRAGYCAKTVNKTGPANLVKAGIKAEIDRIKAKTAEKCEISVEKHLRDTVKLRDEAHQAKYWPAVTALNDQVSRQIGAYNADLSGGLSILDIMAIVGVKAADSHSKAISSEEV